MQISLAVMWSGRMLNSAIYRRRSEYRKASSLSHSQLSEDIKAWRFSSTNQLVKNWNKVFEGAWQWQDSYAGLLITRNWSFSAYFEEHFHYKMNPFVDLEQALYPNGLELGIFLSQRPSQVLIGSFHHAWAWKTALSFTLTKKMNKTKTKSILLVVALSQLGI